MNRQPLAVSAKVIIFALLLIGRPVPPSSATPSQDAASPKLAGPYLGQKLSGMKPERFLLSIFSYVHSTPVFSPDGNRVFWNEHDSMHIMEQVRGEWTPPRHLKFFEKSANEDVPFISPDGKRLYFYVSFREDEKQNKRGIWYVDFSGNSWTSPQSVGPEINDIYGHWQFSVSGKGTLFFPGRDPGNEDDFIMVSRLVNGKYEKPAKVFEKIAAFCPFISPNEDYLVFASGFETDASWKTSLYVCFKKSDGSWGEKINLSSKMGFTRPGQLCPIVSPDGKYLFFMNFWQDARIIEELRPNK